jgi:hypothetical protein
MANPREEIRVSSEIDGYCTKCRMITNHRVVAMVDGVVKRVICLTCDSQHNYRTPPGQKPLKTSKAKRVGKELKRARTAEAPQTFEKWIELKENLTDEPRPYNMNESYTEGEAVSHGKFGLGFVMKEVPPRKMEVMFETEIKTLAMNYR